MVKIKWLCAKGIIWSLWTHLVLLSNALATLSPSLLSYCHLWSKEQGLFVCFIYVATSPYYWFLPYFYRWFFPWKPPNGSQQNWSLRIEGWQADYEILNLVCRGSPGSPGCLYPRCTYMYMPLPLQPSFLFHLNSCAPTHPHLFSVWWLALGEEETNGTFSSSTTL